MSLKEEVVTSTRTILAYTNIRFDRDNIFQNIFIDDNLCNSNAVYSKKSLKFPSGIVVNVQKGVYIRGLITRKPKQHWCPSCKLTETINGKEKNILSVKEHYITINTYDSESPFTEENFKPYLKISYHCSNCNLWYSTKQIHKYPSFLNQITIYISIGHVILNVMIFKNLFKIAGCRSRKDAIDVCTVLWGILNSIDNSWSINTDVDSIDASPKIGLDPVMQNIDFNIGYKIDRYALNILLNGPDYYDYISSCIFEPTSDTNVQIRIKATRPDEHMYDIITLSYKGLQNRDVSMDENSCIIKKVPVWSFNVTRADSFGTLKAEKRLKDQNITITVFGSGKIKTSGRYLDDMDTVYNRLKSIMDDNIDTVKDV